MARGDKLRQSQAMMQAGQSGQASRQRAQEALTQQRTQGAQQITQQGMQVAGMAQQDLQRQQQRDIATGQQALQKRGQDINAADRGIVGGGDAGPLLSPRERNLQAQMDKAQELQGGQFGPPPPPGKDGFSKSAGRQELEAMQAETARQNAIANRQNAAANLRKAELMGNSEAALAERQRLVTPVEQAQKSFDRMMTGKATPADWETIKRDLGDNPDPEVQAALQTQDMSNPALVRVLKEGMAVKGLDYIADSGGDLPTDSKGNVLVDLSSPTMRRWTEATNYVNEYMKAMGPDYSVYAGIDSMESKIRFQNKFAAILTKAGWGMDMGFFGTMTTDPNAQQQPAQIEEMNPVGDVVGAAGEGRTGPGPEGEIPVPEMRGGLRQRGLTPSERKAVEGGGSIQQEPPPRRTMTRGNTWRR